MIKLSKSVIGHGEKVAVGRVLDSEYLGMGREVGKFEDELKEFFGRDVACVVNGTSALQLALFAAGIKNGDEVLVQSLTYVASFQSIAAVGAKAVACDVIQDNLNIDLNDAECRLTDKTKAIMPVHYAGHSQDLTSIYKFADRHKLRVIEDSAHCFGSTFDGKLVGSIGDISCFSFDGIKNITSGEGGCVVSDDPELMMKVREARLLGVVGDSAKRLKNDRSWNFDVTNLGWRFHMSDLMAAIGRVQLTRLPEFAKKRVRLAKRYCELLESVQSVGVIYTNYDTCVPHIFPILVDPGIQIEQLRTDLLKRSIETGVHYTPNHRLSFFADRRASKLRVTENIKGRLMSLPLHPDLTLSQIGFIVSNLSDCIRKQNDGIS